MKPIRQAIEEARRALDCGRALFRENLVPECDACFTTALGALLAAWTPEPPAQAATDAEPWDPKAATLAALEGAGYRRADRLAALWPRASDAPAAEPASTRIDLAPWTEIERLYRFTVWHLDPPFKRPRVRLLALAGATAVVVLSTAVAWRLWARTIATASAVYSSAHAAANAIDGLDATEWLLPDAKLGWLQVNFPSPRALNHVRILNAHNIHFQDRGCEKVRVTIFCHAQPVAAADGTFSAPKTYLDFDFRADCVTHLRVEVLSFFKMGGGLAEIEVD
jgi:hypothetical protein